MRIIDDVSSSKCPLNVQCFDWTFRSFCLIFWYMGKTIINNLVVVRLKPVTFWFLPQYFNLSNFPTVRLIKDFLILSQPQSCHCPIYPIFLRWFLFLPFCSVEFSANIYSTFGLYVSKDLYFPGMFDMWNNLSLVDSTSTVWWARPLLLFALGVLYNGWSCCLISQPSSQTSYAKINIFNLICQG